jgi:hypothetical protein
MSTLAPGAMALAATIKTLPYKASAGRQPCLDEYHIAQPEYKRECIEVG